MTKIVGDFAWDYGALIDICEYFNVIGNAGLSS